MLSLSGAGRGTRGLRRAVLALDARSARELLAASIAVSGVQATWDEMARPVLSVVAQRWADTGTGVEVEHLLSECVIGVFGALAAAAPYPAGARPVLLAGMPGEQHTLPMVVLAAALAQRRVTCRPLGADLPTSALVSAIRRTAPVALVLWSQLAPTADPDALRSLPRIRPRGPYPRRRAGLGEYRPAAARGPAGVARRGGGCDQRNRETVNGWRGGASAGSPVV